MKITPLEAWIFAMICPDGAGLSRERIDAHQLKMLRETVDWAKARSPFYRERLAGVSASDLGSLEDLARFPFTTAEDIRRRPLRLPCVSQSELSRVVTLRTSGTAGDPKRIFFTAGDLERTIDFFHHGMSTIVGPGDRILILLPGAVPAGVGDLLAKGLERLGATGIPHGFVREPHLTLDIMERERIDCLVGVPVQALGLARLSGGKAAPKSILLSTDHVPDAVRAELQRIWNCEVYTHYGMTEMGFGGGLECRAKAGYHLREADLYVEIVDPESGTPVADGLPGEVVFTTLSRRGMPLIRYRTGDLSRFLPTPCPCGTTLKTMERVKTRIRAVRNLSHGGAVSMADLDEVIFSVERVLDFRASLTCRQGGDRLQIEAWLTDSDSRKTPEEIVRALRSLPVIQSALDAGTLALDVSIPPAGPVGDGAKRTLLDLRAESPL